MGGRAGGKGRWRGRRGEQREMEEEEKRRRRGGMEGGITRRDETKEVEEVEGWRDG